MNHHHLTQSLHEAENMRTRAIKASMADMAGPSVPCPNPATLGNSAGQILANAIHLRDSILALCTRLVGPMVCPNELSRPPGNPNEELSMAIKLEEANKRLRDSVGMLEELHKQVANG